MARPAPQGILPDLAQYIEASVKKFQACVTEVSHTLDVDAAKTTVHLQYVKFDPNTGEPRFDVFAKVLAKHVV